jgi:hypothetical protein
LSCRIINRAYKYWFSGGSLTIPSAMNIVVHLFPEPASQAKAVTIFGAMGALGIGMYKGFLEIICSLS